jgi:hypothetical protein
LEQDQPSVKRLLMLSSEEETGQGRQILHFSSSNDMDRLSLPNPPLQQEEVRSETMTEVKDLVERLVWAA